MPAAANGFSSRALFDFEEENRLFEAADDRAYMQLQLVRLEQPARPGVAFSLVNKLLAFNSPGAARVEVVILSRNDPVSGLRVKVVGGGCSGLSYQLAVEPTPAVVSAATYRGADRMQKLIAAALKDRTGEAISAGDLLDTGKKYDPTADAWTTISTTGAPSARSLHTAVWTGVEMIVWGAAGASPVFGGRYNPITDTWLPVSSTGSPSNTTSPVVLVKSARTIRSLSVSGGVGRAKKYPVSASEPTAAAPASSH